MVIFNYLTYSKNNYIINHTSVYILKINMLLHWKYDFIVVLDFIKTQ